jgi:hypothetical protein
MLITNVSRQCVIKLKKYSVRKTTSSNRSHRHSIETNNTNSDGNRHPNVSNVNIDASTSQLAESRADRSLLGYLLNCKPCLQVTDAHQHKMVGSCCCAF